MKATSEELSLLLSTFGDAHSCDVVVGNDSGVLGAPYRIKITKRLDGSRLYEACGQSERMVLKRGVRFFTRHMPQLPDTIRYRIRP